MELYIYMYISLCVASVIEITFSKKNNNLLIIEKKNLLRIPIIYVVVFIALYYILALRKFTGTDTYVYFRIFNISSLQSNIELGFRWLMQLTQSYGGDFFEFEKIVAIVTLIPIMITIYYFSPFPLYSTLILYSAGCYFGFFNVMRQGVALGLILFALSFLFFSSKSSFIRWGISAPIILVAYLFHTTSLIIIIVIALIFLLRKCLKRGHNTIWIFYAILFATFMTKVDILQMIFRLATSLPIGSVADKYVSLYGDSSYLISNSSGVLLINFFSILILFILNSQRIKESKMALTIAAILGIYLILLSTRNGAQLYTRILYYMDILVVLIFPMILKDSLNRKQYVFITVIVQVTYILFNFLRMIMLNYNGIMPYGIVY